MDTGTIQISGFSLVVVGLSFFWLLMVPLDFQKLANGQKAKIEDLNKTNQTLVKDLTKTKQLVEELKNKIQRNMKSAKQSLLNSGQSISEQKFQIEGLIEKNLHLANDLARKDHVIEDLITTQHKHKVENESLKHIKQTLEKSLKNLQNDLPLAKSYLKKYLNAKDSEGNIKLHIASRDGHLEEVDILLKFGADVNAKCSYKWTALHEAVLNGHINIAKLLLQNGADVNAKTCDRYYPLHCAAGKGYSEITKLLLQNGANTNVKNYQLVTPLHQAVYYGHPEIVQILLKYGARKDLKDMWNDTPLEDAMLNETKKETFSKLLVS